jgi:hypothetical protein
MQGTLSPRAAAAVDAAVQQRRRAIVATVIGNGLEWFDFTVYSFFAVIIAKLFFPTGNELTSVLLTVATFGVGFFMRSVGGIVLGVYADKVGRKAALSLTILLMAAGTALIGIAPTYEQAGIAAPLMIVVARLLQGFSAGGEMGGATAFLTEYAPPEKRAYYSSWIQSSIGFAVLVLRAVVRRDHVIAAAVARGRFRHAHEQAGFDAGVDHVAPAERHALTEYRHLHDLRIGVDRDVLRLRLLPVDVVQVEPFGPRHPLALAVFEAQQRFVREIGRVERAAGQIAGRADGEHLLVEQPARGVFGRRLLAHVVDADVEFRGRHRCQAVAHDQAQLDVGIGGAKVRQPRREPQQRDAGRARDRQFEIAVRFHDVVCGFRALHEQTVDLRRVLLAGDRQPQRTVFAHEQRAAEEFLQLLDLAADRALGQVQFGGGFRETRVPHGGFERDEALKRRQGRDAHGGQGSQGRRCLHDTGGPDENRHS